VFLVRTSGGRIELSCRYTGPRYTTAVVCIKSLHGIPDSYGLGICSFMLSLEKVIVDIGAVERGDGERAVILLVVMTFMVPVS